MVDVNIKGINEEELALIDKASEITKRSRSNFMLTSSIEIANKIIKIVNEGK